MSELPRLALDQPGDVDGAIDELAKERPDERVWVLGSATDPSVALPPGHLLGA